MQYSISKVHNVLEYSSLPGNDSKPMNQNVFAMVPAANLVSLDI